MQILMLLFYGHFYSEVRLNRPSDIRRRSGEVKDETPFLYSHPRALIQVLEACRERRYQFSQEDAPPLCLSTCNISRIVV